MTRRRKKPQRPSRTVSVSAAAYERLKVLAEARGMTIGQAVDGTLDVAEDAPPQPEYRQVWRAEFKERGEWLSLGKTYDSQFAAQMATRSMRDVRITPYIVEVARG